MEQDEILKHFHACENCEPVMCCRSSMVPEFACGCMGLPVDFKPTDKCDDTCELKKALNEEGGDGK